MSPVSSEKDKLYDAPIGDVTGFKFDQAVAAVFPDMIERSVPGYHSIIYAIGLLAGRFAGAGTRCYDLGCSLGAGTLSMREQIDASCRIIAVDNSSAMLEKCQEHIKENPHKAAVDLVCADLRQVDISMAAVVVLNFTLQFIPKVDRTELLAKIYRGMLPGGILILSEKLSFIDERQQQLQTAMYHDFKKANGYSDLAISQKRKALEKVMIPESLEQHQRRLADAGFSSSEVWFQYFNFVSIIALK